MNIEQVIESLDEEIGKLQQAKAILNGTGVTTTGRTRRHMSAEAKARIAAAQRARWAKIRAAKKK